MNRVLHQIKAPHRAPTMPEHGRDWASEIPPAPTPSHPTLIKSIKIGALFVLLAFSPLASASPLKPDHFTTALTLFDQALFLQTTSDTAASLFSSAADEFELTLTAGDLSEATRAHLYVNTANAAALAHDWPRAILNYRRAELLRPALPGLAERLAEARKAVAASQTKPIDATSPAKPPANPSTPSQLSLVSEHEQPVLDMLSVWTRSQPRILWIASATLTWCGLWAYAALLIITRPRGRLTPRWPIAVFSVLCLLSVAGAYLVLAPAYLNTDAIAMKKQDLRTSPTQLPSESPSTLYPGSECKILEVRSEGLPTLWARIQTLSLSSTSTSLLGWVPLNSLEKVVPDQAHESFITTPAFSQ